MGIDLGGTKIAAVVLDDRGDVVHRNRVPTPVGDYHAIVAELARLVRAGEREVGAGVTVGVGVPGAIDKRTGRIKGANAVALNERPLEVDLTAALGRPVCVANDADCFALSEASDGAGAGDRVVFGAILGTGAGGGIVVDGVLLGGPNAITGEWGHIPLPWPRADELPGPPCFCGRFGCVEMFVAGPALERDHAESGGGNRVGVVVTAARIAAEAAAGDTAAQAALVRHADRLARSLAAVINVLDPDCVVLGGGVSNLTHLYDTVPHLWDRYVFSDTVSTRLVPALHGDDSGVRGAAWLGATAGA